MKPKNGNENTELETVELDGEQLDRIAGGNRIDTCPSCGGQVKRFDWGLEFCMCCGALLSDPNGEKAPR